MNPFKLRPKQVSKIFLSFFITMILLGLMQSYISVNAEDYEVFTITGASSSIDLTYVYGEYLYVANGTYLLQYSLENESLSDSINLGGSVSVNNVKGKADELYLNITDGGSKKYTVISLDTFTREHTVDDSDLASFTDDLNNLVWMSYGGVHYWAYTLYDYTSGAGSAPLSEAQQITYKGYDSTGTYERFYCFSSFHWNENSFGVTPKQICYVYNATSDAEVNTSYSGSAYFGGTRLIITLRLVTSVLDGSAKQNTAGNKDNKYITEPSYNLDMLVTGTNLSLSWGYGGVRDKAYTTNTYDCADGGSAGKLHYWIDLTDKWFKLRSNALTEIKVATFTSGSFGAITTLTSAYSINLASQTFIDGVFSASYYQDESNTQSTYVCLVDTNNVPRAYKVVGSNLVSVGTLTSYTPLKCNVFRSSVNFVTVFTVSGSTSLYVCRNLIEDQYIYASYGVQIIAQLYTVYDSSDNLVFSVRFMLNDSSYTRLNGESYYFYLDGAYQSTGTLTSDGRVSMSFSVISPPRTLSFYANMTGYSGKWFNITAYSSTNIDVSDTETPVLSLSVTDNPTTNTLSITTEIRRFTSELLSNTYFDTNPLIDINVKEYGINGYYHEYDLESVEVADGSLSSALGYTSPNTYLVTYSYTATDQSIFLYNCTENINIMFTFDSTSKDIVIGGIVVLPPTPTPTEPDTPDVTTPVLVQALISWFPAIVIILVPTVALLALGIYVNASSGVSIILLLIGLNLGVGLGFMSAIIPFYFMVTTFLLDAILFVFLLKSGVTNE